jgi:hypothetical protein
MKTIIPFALLGSIALGCSSGSTVVPSDQPSTALRCCAGGAVHLCANTAAQDRCNAGVDTVDCTKTAEVCGAPAPDAGPTPEDALPSPETTPVVPPKKAFGALCNAPEECQGELCLTMDNGTAGTCNKSCTTEGDCPSRHICEFATKLGIRVCIAKGDKRIGDPCVSQYDCESTVCLKSDTTAFCSKGCALAEECPPGWTCSVIGSGGRFCLR